MKTLFTLLFVCTVMSFQAFSQNLSNGGFELWTGNPAHPTGWSTTESITGFNDGIVMQDQTPGNYTEGSSAAKLRTDTLHTPLGNFLVEGDVNYGTGVFVTTPQPGINYYGTPFTDMPDSIKFDYKVGPTATDTGAYEIRLTHWNGVSADVVGRNDGSNYLTGTGGNWVTLAKEVTYFSLTTPDTLIVRLHSSFHSNVFGTEAWYDNVRLVYNSVGIFESTPVSVEMGLYPNPANAVLHFTPGIVESGSSVQVYDMEGRLALSTIAEDNSITVSSLAGGNYILRLEDKSGTVRTGRFELKR